ncbi:hypothetical protein L1987_57538 [Smallanthus sonchifolius]|uniref:Uncharacterized protein n=1 Tax=Smallanthus sonchifolius TaxID=185202 RepID=A0ACB9DCZ6_9ASTR|nr:hypothetical protein L1987_57538 [Smallanthus sonchifolius]
MNSFMSSIKSTAASAVIDGDEKKSNPDQSLNSDLVSNAKLVAEAAQCVATNQSDKIDKPKVAGAAEDLLDAAKEYGKFDETQGTNDYLHRYEKSGTTATPPPAEAPPAMEGKKAEAPPPAEEKKEEYGSGFGAADAFKAAGSFFN